MVKKYWLETLVGIAASAGMLGITIYLNMTAITLWWAHNWWWVVGMVALVTSKFWATPLWRAYQAISGEIDTYKIRKQHYLMLAGVTAKMQEGFDTEYHHQPLGLQLKVHNPYTKMGQVSVQDKPGQALIEGPAIPQAPHFAQMKHLITKKHMPLCFLADGPAFGTVSDLLSMAITGKPGRGKTTALMYYVTMLLANGAEVVVWDPHGAMNELAVLNGKALPKMPETARLTYLDRREDIINSVPVLQSKLVQRDDLYRDGHQTRHPLLILADELPVLADYDAGLLAEYKAMNKKRIKDGDEEIEVPSLITLIRRFVLEARKWNCYFIGSGQSMDAQVLPTKVTENMSSRIVFFSSDRRARMSGLETDAIKKYLPLIRRAGSGVMVFDCARWDEPAIGAIPMIEVDDMLEYLGVETTGEDDGQIGASICEADLFSALPNFEKWDTASSNILSITELSAVPEEGINEPGEKLHEDSEDVPELGSDDYLLSDLQIELFAVYYKDCGNIAESLSRVKNDKGQGLGRRYFKHASWVVKSKGLKRA